MVSSPHSSGVIFVRTLLVLSTLALVLLYTLLTFIQYRTFPTAFFVYVVTLMVVLSLLTLEGCLCQTETTWVNHVLQGHVHVLEALVVAPLLLVVLLATLYKNERELCLWILFNVKDKWGNQLEPYLVLTHFLLILLCLFSVVSVCLRLNQELKGRRLLWGTLVSVTSVVFRTHVFSLFFLLNKLPNPVILLVLIVLTVANSLVVTQGVAKGAGTHHVLILIVALLLAPVGHVVAVGHLGDRGDHVGLSELERTKLSLASLLKRQRLSFIYHFIVSLVLFIQVVVLVEVYGEDNELRWVYLLLALLWIFGVFGAFLALAETKKRLEAASKWLELTPHRSRVTPKNTKPSVSVRGPHSPLNNSTGNDVKKGVDGSNGSNTAPSAPPTTNLNLQPQVHRFAGGDSNSRLFPNPLYVARSLATTLSNQPGTNRCERSTCVVCTFFIIGPDFLSQATGKKYRFMTSVSCNTTKVIYLVTCGKCKKQYVGKTEQALKSRHYGHRREIELGSTPLGLHFARGCGYIFFRMQVIDRCEDGGGALARREGYWIQELKTLEPYGINSRAEQAA